jgi:hypothetical protein
MKSLPTRNEIAAVLLGFGALSIGATYPVITALTTRLPSDLGDPLLTAWTLAWDASRLPHGLAGVWDPPNFFPYSRTLAYSDHLLGIAVFTAPLQWLTGQPILVYNLAFLASGITSAVGMYLLARSLTGRRDAAAIAAAIYVSLPFRVSHLAHLQWLTTGWLPLGLWALHRYFEGRKFFDLVAAAACYFAQAMTATYFLYFSLVPYLIVAAWEWVRRPLPVPTLARHLGPVLLLLALAIAPVARSYALAQHESGHRRTITDIRGHSADLADYFRAAPRLWLWARLGTTGGEHELFPGAIALGLAAVAIASTVRQSKPDIATYATIAGVACVFSLGPTPTVWGHALNIPGPYALLLKIVPGLDGMRAVARLGLIVGLAVAVLAAFGAASLLERVSARAGGVAVVAIVAGVVLEGWAAPVPAPAFRPLTADERAAYEYLRALPRGGAIELPASIAEFERESRYQYLTLVHHHPIVNGQTGYVTPLFGFLAGAQSPLNEIDRLGDGIAALRAAGVRYVIVHHGDLPPASAGAWSTVFEAERSQMVAVRRFGETTIATLQPAVTPAAMAGSPIDRASMHVSASHASDRTQAMLDGDLGSRWLTGVPQSGTEWVSIRFDRPRDVASIHMRLAERSFGDYPRELVVDSIGVDGTVTLFRGSVLPSFVQGLLADGDYPDIVLPLPPNRSGELRLRQQARTRRFFWSIHELTVWER